MSYFDDASLVMIPSGYKDQKVYSVKPLDGSGDLTFSRASSATRVASNGLIEKVRTNLILQSQDFTTTWFNSGTAGGTSTTITANSAPAPDGTNSADLIAMTRPTTSIGTYVSQTQSTSAGVYASTIYLKAKDATHVGKQISAWQFDGAERNLIDITLTNSWVRYSLLTSTSLPSGSSNELLAFGFRSGRGSTTSVEFYAWGAQGETGDVATDYIATTSAAVSVGPVSGLPRLDYLNSTCPRLLLEPQRTNQILQSEAFGSASWAAFNASISSNVSATLDPQGYYGADKLVEDSSSAFHDADQVQTYTAAAYTISVFAKAAGRNHIFLQHFDGTTFFTSGTFNLANGTVSGSGSIVSYGNGWYRCSFTATTASGTGKAYVNLSNGTTGNYQGDGTSGVYLWGCQLEAGAYATSYIPTLGTSVTRVADLAQKTSASALIGQTEGTIYWEIQVDTPTAGLHEDLLNVDNGAYGNSIYIIKTATAGLLCDIVVSNTNVARFEKTGITAGTYKCALGYANNNSAFFVNGVQVGTTDTSCAIPAMSRIQLGNGALGPSTGLTKQLLLFPTRLSNSDLAALTA